MDRRSGGVMMFAAMLLAACLPALQATAQEEKPLEDILPQNALVTFWSPDPVKLIESVNGFTPGTDADIPALFQIAAEHFAVPENVFEAPAAVVIFPGEEGEESDGPPGAFLFSMKVLDALKETLGEPDDEGVYEGTNPDGEGFFATTYRGYAAFSESKAYLKALAAAGEPYAPSAEAKKIRAGAQLFVHVNVPLVLEIFKEQIEQMREQIAESMTITVPDGTPDVQTAQQMKLRAVDFMFGLIKEFKSFDAAISFDAQGLKIMTATAVTKTGNIARYLTPSDGLGKLEPPLPALDQFAIAAWGKWDEKMLDTLLSDYQQIVKWFLGALPETDKIAKDAALIFEELKGCYGERFATVMNMSDAGMGVAQVVEVKKPDQIKDIMVRSADTFAKIMPAFMSMSPNPAASFKYTYEPNVATIAGVKVDRLKAAFNSDDPEVTAAMDAMMKLYGPDGLSQLLAVVDDKLVISMSEEAMELALGAIQGRVGVELLRDDLVVKSMTKKIGLDKDVIFLIVPVRMIELGATMMAKMMGNEGNAPIPMPFATPAAFGAKAVEGGILRCDAYVPQACIAECVAAAMGMMGVMMGGGGMQPF